jgi:Ca2+/Na+ antiporter
MLKHSFMSLLLAAALIIVGFMLLIKGADWMVNGASTKRQLKRYDY